MAAVLVIGRGPRIYLVGGPTTGVSEVGWGSDLTEAAARRSGMDPADVPEELVRRLRQLPKEKRLVASSRRFSEVLGARAGREVGVADLGWLREARSRLGTEDAAEERRFLRDVARSSLERGLRAPDEILITLAREEERLERAVGREARAAEAFLPVPDTSLAVYAREWSAARATLESHHARLLAQLEAQARRLIPNLSRTVGPRVAARLLATAGGLAPLGRLSAPRLQLLGARRRPSPHHGPRYGVLYRAEGMEEVPFGRRGAYARSLAALAAIAARVDATTGRDVSNWLVARRDRRIQELRAAHR